MSDKITSLDLIDFYDFDELEKLQEKRAKKWLKLFLKAKRGDKKAIEAIRKHETEDLEIKKRANSTGYYWV